MKDKHEPTTQVIEKSSPKVISRLAKTVKRVVDHKTLKKIIRHTEQEEGID